MTNLENTLKSRHYFANKGPFSQSYGFSSSHVLMWELYHKEGWALEGWCFWTVVLKSRDITLPTKVRLVSATVFPVVMYGCESWTVKKAEAKELMLLHCGVVEDSWESHGQQGDPTSPSKRKSVLGVHWKDWCWSWNSNILAIWCEELTHLKRTM